MLGGLDELNEDFEVLGLADQVKHHDDAPFVVWSENATIVRVFLELELCWERGGMLDGSERMTLSPERIKSTLELFSIKRRDWEYVSEGVKVMERAARKKLYTTS